MKKMTRSLLATALALTVASAGAATLDSDAQKIGYAIGVDMGQSMAQIAPDNTIDLDALVEGLKQAYAGNKLEMTPEEMNATMQNFAEQRMKAVQQEMEQAAEKNAAEGQKFLEENKTKDGVKTTDSGLQYSVEKEGDGAKPTEADSVTVNYEGRLIDGTVFDSSYERGEPVTFKLTDVIPGWTEGLQLMKKGAKYTFFIPAELAYGEASPGAAIGPNSTLIFDVELVDVGQTDDKAAAGTEQAAEAAAPAAEDKAAAGTDQAAESAAPATEDKAAAGTDQAAEAAAPAAEDKAEAAEDKAAAEGSDTANK